MLLLIMGTFMGAYPLMYFAQEFIPLYAAILSASVLVLVVIGIRSLTIMEWRVALFGTTLPAATILALTLLAATHPRLQGILITGVFLTLFVVVMSLMPRLKLRLGPRAAASGELRAGPAF
jgi:hypothetical protein